MERQVLGFNHKWMLLGAEEFHVSRMAQTCLWGYSLRRYDWVARSTLGTYLGT